MYLSKRKNCLYKKGFGFVLIQIFFRYCSYLSTNYSKELGDLIQKCTCTISQFVYFLSYCIFYWYVMKNTKIFLISEKLEKSNELYSNQSCATIFAVFSFRTFNFFVFSSLKTFSNNQLIFFYSIFHSWQAESLCGFMNWKWKPF